MRKRFFLALLVTTVTFAQRPTGPQVPSTVRIGLTQNASTVTVRASRAFTIQQNSTRTAKFTMALAVDPNATGPMTSASLQYRTLMELDGGKIFVLPKGAKTQIQAGDVPIEFDSHTYRGKIEVFGNSRNTFTVVNELPLEDYLLGVVP